MRVVILGCLLLVVVGAVAPAGAQSTPGSTDRETVLTVALEEDGDARWIVETRLALEGPNETAGFRALGKAFADGETETATSPETVREIAASVSEETGRPMSVENVTRSWRIENATVAAYGSDTVTEGTPTIAQTQGADDGSDPTGTEGDSGARTQTGVLSLSFTWTNFARAEDDQVVVGDAFEAGDRWLPGLREGQTLVLRAPANYSITQASVGHTRTTVRWEGPTSFEDATLRATFTSTNDSIGPPGGPPELSLPISTDALLAVLAAILLGVVAYGVARRSPASDGESESAGASSEPGGDGSPPFAQPDDGGAGEPEPDPFAGVDEALLSDEERIERHLQAAGGRLKQAEIVDRTEWSTAKVSQVLSQMDEAGRVDKLRIGRENLISLPEEE